jgi:hypothetical protein
MNLTPQELERLKSSKTSSEWNAACSDIKKARANEYPPDWYEVMLKSGLMNQIVKSFK